MKNVGIYYHGGCGGHFLHHFLLTSLMFESTYNTKFKVKKEPKQIEKIKSHFYFQFNKNNKWLKNEMWPINNISKSSNQLFLFCGPQNYPETIFQLDCIKICPYISDQRDWFRTIIFKNTNYFRGYLVNFSTIRKQLKRIKKSPPVLKIPNCDYYLDIINFIKDKSERLKLCNFLNIVYNETMEEFVSHYQQLHHSLKKTRWVDNLPK